MVYISTALGIMVTVLYILTIAAILLETLFIIKTFITNVTELRRNGNMTTLGAKRTVW